MSKKGLNVEQLKFYGKTIAEIVDSMPISMKMKVGKIIVGSIVKKVEFFGFVPFMMNVMKERKRLIKVYPDAYQKALELAKEGANQFITMISLFNIIAQKEGREKAYEFTKNIFQGYAKYTIPAMYDVDNLRQCVGDCFINYKKYNIALFTASDDYHVKEIKDEKDCLTIIVDKCASVEIANAFDCPEVGMLGCDHDLAGYPIIENQVDSEFRRYHTIAKGDLYCDFMFYKKGTVSLNVLNNK
jgi:hypothetical protein